ncbi:Hypothetical protein NTJ_04893 [Nesidiocoris tenuis]|uniref:Nucleotidyl transferase domain-containing protein n=1 Tax=Nesidiocoris tenuis TaxID=355587 RepID=A0ABN7AMF7_9HEMI|nr:Hypothetical protein NTJ_04893 [Nesidiocoris tenuis]
MPGAKRNPNGSCIQRFASTARSSIIKSSQPYGCLQQLLSQQKQRQKAILTLAGGGRWGKLNRGFPNSVQETVVVDIR